MKWAWAMLAVVAGGGGVATSGCSGRVSHSGAQKATPAEDTCEGALALSACDDLPALDVEEACERVAAVSCQRAHECGQVALSTLELCRQMSVADCRTLAYAAQRRGGYDGKAAACCLQHIAEGPCGDATRGQDQACHDMFRGRRKLGEDCDDTADCAPSTYCALGLRCPGKCAAYAAIGEPCGTGRFCALDADCIDGRCVRYGCADEPCGVGLPSCAIGLQCVGTSSASTCQAEVTVGHPCDLGTASCDYVLACDFRDDRETRTGTCQERGGLDHPCLLSVNCRADYACVGADLGSQRLGSCQPALVAGSPCTAGSTTDVCGVRGGALRCEPKSATCRPARLDGEDCDPELDACRAGRCDASTKRCTSLKQRGEGCAVDEDCWSLSCAAGQCVVSGCSSSR